MEFIRPNEKIYRKELNVDAGTLAYGKRKVNNVFDLYLLRTHTGDYRLVVHMYLQFFFKADGLLRWTAYEKREFVRNFVRVVESTWEAGAPIYRLPNGREITLDYVFHNKIGGISIREHWELHIRKTKLRSNNRVNWFFGLVRLNAEDFSDLNNKFKSNLQRLIAHEFGHMIGLADEYHHQSRHRHDKRSIMNTGPTVRGRHVTVFHRWLDSALSHEPTHE